MNPPRTWFPKHYADVVQRLRVTAGFVLAAAFLYFANPSPISLAVGIPIAAIGLALRTWAAGHLAKNETLAIGGPFAYTRNPLYLGTLIVALGFSAAAESALLIALFGAAFLLIYFPVIEQEEQHLLKLFPGYSAYADRVPLLLPAFKSHTGCNKCRFSLWKRNQEYKAVGGFLIVSAFLAWRAGVLS